MEELNFIRCARNKYEVIKKILKIDHKYDCDYLMQWTKKDLINYYNNEARKVNIENETKGIFGKN